MANKFDVALICLNGHLINSNNKVNPELNTPFCSKCGEKTITTCMHCKAEIVGQVIDEIIPVPRPEIKVPDFCPMCSEPYPWKQRAKLQEEEDQKRKRPGMRAL